MPEESSVAAFSLKSRAAGEPAPVLVGVSASGWLDAVLFELTVRQTYRNTSPRVLEVVYTFPLPPMAVLLGFASELNGARQEGVIVARPEAEQRYERALAEGDAPVMLEAVGGGVHSANIGNLKPGDEVVLEARFAQWLSFEQGRLRLAIPTTIAPRYGSPERAGLQPQQAPQYSLAAEYPLHLSLTLGEALVGAAVECPTHRLTPVQPCGEARAGHRATSHLELAPGAWLDRDLVVLVTPREPRPSLVVQADDAFDRAAPVVVMAALQPLPLAVPRERISLKLLVDCSGSMAGDSMTSALAALRGVVASLGAHDRISLSCFGSTVDHRLRPAWADAPTLRGLLPLIDGIAADMGGTEMEAALGAVFELGQRIDRGAEAAVDGSDVLLITDGEIWQAEAMVAAARRSGHRVFAIGVGSAPAEGVLRALAEATGGACEFATPGEALEAAARRMLQRIRQEPMRNVRVEWGARPLWQAGPAAGVFGGDTVIAMAGFAQPLRAGGVRLLADDAQGGVVELARGEAGAPCVSESLARMGAAQRMAGAVDEAALALALRYQLMSTQTNCVLVHQRADADKVAEAAQLHLVKSMPAAGWGGAGTVMSPRASMTVSVNFIDSMPLGAMSGMGGEGGASAMFADAFAPQPQRSVPSSAPRGAPAAPITLDSLALLMSMHLATSGNAIAGLAAHCGSARLDDAVRQALDEAEHAGLSADEAWIVLAHWMCGNGVFMADVWLAEHVRPHVASIEPALMARAVLAFDRHLGRRAEGGQDSPRRERLRRALGNAPPGAS